MEGSRVVIVHPEQLEPYLPAWEELAAAAVETNVFYEPWMLLPALRLWGGGDEVVFVLVFTAEGSNGVTRERLTGLFPLQYQTHYREVPVRALKLWQYDYCFLSTPLVRKHGAARTVRTFLEWLAANPFNAALMEFRDIEGDGAFHELLLGELRPGQRACVMDSYTRPVLTRRLDADAYLRESLSKKRRKELNRLGRRLADCGRVECVELERSDDVSGWIDEFLTLEAAGWKGRAGSAMKLDAASREFFTTIVCEAFRRKRLMTLGLYIGGRPVAMKCNLLAAPGSFSFKIAYDETLGRFSPGMQLEIENIRHFHSRCDIEWMDSCTAVEDHFMMNHLWRDRKSIQTLTLATGHWSGDLVVSVLPIRQWIRSKLKECLGIRP